MFKIISITLLLVAACLIATIILRKIPQLSLIDVAAVPKPKEEEIKEKIIIERIQRRLAQVRKILKFIVSFLNTFFKKARKGWADLKLLEQRFTMRDKNKIVLLLEAAKTKLEQAPAEAEKTYLEIIKIDNKNIAAYEGLSEVYLSRKDWQEAKQILRFLTKLSPRNFVKYAFALAEVEFKEGNYAKALKLAAQIINKGASEPRYLDFFIETAIMDGNREMAVEGLELLQKVNPENGKIAEFENRIENMPL